MVEDIEVVVKHPSHLHTVQSCGRWYSLAAASFASALEDYWRCALLLHLVKMSLMMNFDAEDEENDDKKVC
jgi:hypothetical protein